MVYSTMRTSGSLGPHEKGPRNCLIINNSITLLPIWLKSDMLVHYGTAEPAL